MVYSRLKNKAEFSRFAGVTPAAVTKACKGFLKDACVGKQIDIDHPAAVEYVKRLEDKRNETVPATGFDPRYEEALAWCKENDKYTITGLQQGIGISFDRARKIIKMLGVTGIIPEKPTPTRTAKPKEVIYNVVPPQAAQPAPATQPPIPSNGGGHTKRNADRKSEALDNLNSSEPYLHEIPANIEKFADMTLRQLISQFGSDTAFLDWLKATKAIEDINEKRLKNAKTKGELVSRELVKKGIIEPIDSAHTRMLTDGAKAMSVRASAMARADEPVEEIERFIAEQVSSFIRPVKTKIKRALRDI